MEKDIMKIRFNHLNRMYLNDEQAKLMVVHGIQTVLPRNQKKAIPICRLIA